MPSPPPVTLARVSGPVSGPTLVVGPALGTSSRSLWGDVASALGDDLSILAWELPGHGGAAPASRPVSVQGLARALAALVRAGSTAAVVELSARRWFAPSATAESAPRRAALLQELRDVDAESYALACEALAEWDAGDRLSSVRMPVLALWGEHDVVAPEASSLELARGVARGAAAMLPGVAHLAPAEDPALVTESLRRFLHRLGEGEAHPRGR